MNWSARWAGLLLALVSLSGSAAEPVYHIRLQRMTPLISVPVQLGEEHYFFLLDTGSSYHVIDRNFIDLLGDPLQTLAGAGGAPITVHPPLPAYLGDLLLGRHKPMLAMELGPLRRASGQLLYGVLGLPLLHRYAWLLDFERRELLAYPAATAPPGSFPLQLPIRFNALGQPLVTLTLVGEQHSFLLDTGVDGDGALTAALYDQLQKAGQLHDPIAGQSLTVVGSMDTPTARLEMLTVAGQDYQQLRLRRADKNLLGLGFLARHRVWLDFPGGRLLLAPR